MGRRILARRTAFIAGLAALLTGASVTGDQFLASAPEPDQGLAVGAVEDFPPNTVTYVPTGHLFLVNWGDGLRAIYDQPPGTGPECTVRYYAFEGDVVEQSEQYAAGGFFRGECSPVHFSWWRGENLEATCECGLDHFRVRVENGRVIIDTTKRYPFAWAY